MILLLRQSGDLGGHAALETVSSLAVNDFHLGSLVSSGSEFAQCGRSDFGITRFNRGQHLLAQRAHTAFDRLVCQRANGGFANVLFCGAGIGHKGSN